MSTEFVAPLRDPQERGLRVLLLCSPFLFTSWALLLHESPVCAKAIHSAGTANQQLYLISGTPFPHGESIFPVNLYVLRDDKIDTARQLLQPQQLDSLYCHQGKRFCIVTWFEARDQVAFLLVPMDRPWSGKKLRAPSKQGNCVLLPAHYNLLELPDKPLTLGLRFFCSLERSGYLLGLSLIDESLTKLPFEAYRNLLASGYGGPGVYPGDRLIVQIDTSGRILVRISGGEVDLGLQVPEALLHRSGLSAIPVRNNSLLAVLQPGTTVRKGEQREAEEENIYLIRAAEEATWRAVAFPGWTIREMGAFIVGYRQEPGRGVPSPGFEERRQEMTETGTPFDWRVEKDRYYLPGILFVYDSRSRKLYRWETNQGDSEVLLVEGDMVYYRVNRSIFRARMGEEELEEHTLLVEDDVVPDIHWAFMGPPYPKESE